MNTSFCVGYKGNLDHLVRILDVSDKVGSVYTSGLGGFIGAGRPQFLESMREIEVQARRAHARGVQFEVALNGSTGFRDRWDTKWWGTLAGYLRDLATAGVDAVVVSHPLLIELAREHTDLRVVVSTICEVATARAARHYERLGGHVIVPSMNVNMNLKELRLMKETLTTATLRIMLNERCMDECPWRRAHFDQNSSVTQNTNRMDYYYMNCMRLYLRQPYLLLANNTIRPEDLHHYKSITSRFKILGRVGTLEDLLVRIKAYSEERFDGNYVRLIISEFTDQINIPNRALDGLIERKWECGRICESCRHCIELAESIVGHGGRDEGADSQVH